MGELFCGRRVDLELRSDLVRRDPAGLLQMIGVTFDVVRVPDKVHVDRRERLTGARASRSLIERACNLTIGLFGRQRADLLDNLGRRPSEVGC